MKTGDRETEGKINRHTKRDRDRDSWKIKTDRHEMRQEKKKITREERSMKMVDRETEGKNTQTHKETVTETDRKTNRDKSRDRGKKA